MHRLGDDKLGYLFHWRWKRLDDLFLYRNMSCSHDILLEVLGRRFLYICGLVYGEVRFIYQGRTVSLVGVSL